MDGFPVAKTSLGGQVRHARSVGCDPACRSGQPTLAAGQQKQLALREVAGQTPEQTLKEATREMIAAPGNAIHRTLRICIPQRLRRLRTGKLRIDFQGRRVPEAIRPERSNSCILAPPG
jgi:hypothetical protein